MSSSGPGGTMAQLDEYVEQLRQKLPVAPPGLMDAYVKWAPWVAIVFGVLGLLFGIVGFILGTVGTSLAVMFGGAEGVRFGADFFVALGLAVLGSGLDLAGGYFMLRREATGWWLLAVALVVSLLSNLVRLSIIGLVVSLAIAYVHVHVRPRYM